MHKPLILLLEDDTTDVQLIRRALQISGMDAELLVADSAEAYQQALNRPSLDLVISDSSMPNLSFSEAISFARTRHPNTPFIVLSGTLDPHTVEQMRAAGAMACLEKNDLTQLAPVMRATLTQQAPLIELPQQATLRLVRAIKELSVARDVPTIQAIVRSAARELNGADGATFVLRDGEQCYYADEDAIAPLWKGQRFPMSTCISGWAMLHQQAAIVTDITQDDRIPIDAYRPTFVRSLVMVPIRAEAPIGAIGNYWASHHVPTPEEVYLIQALADSTSVALENVQVYQQLEQRVMNRTAQLKELNSSLEEFSYFVSHDLRAPLRHIEAFSEILREDLGQEAPAEVASSLGHIRSATATMRELLKGLQDLAHSNQRPLQLMNVDMNELVSIAVELARHSAGNAAEFRVASLPPSYGDKALLRQVWINLIGNAAKYSSSQTQPLIEIGSNVVDGQTRYFVRDNGVGFHMKETEHLFRAFRRLGSSRGFSGSGIGLAIVHRIISRHGGTIWAESEPGQGASFYFTLQARSNQQQSVGLLAP